MELKPCPFCGGEIRIVRLHGSYGEPWYARCDRCEVNSYYYKTEAQAIEEWSVRPERTCSPTGKWESISQTQAVRHVFCSACGHEFGMDRKDTIPFERTRLVGLPYYCPECGARVTRKVVER